MNVDKNGQRNSKVAETNINNFHFNKQIEDILLQPVGALKVQEEEQLNYPSLNEQIEVSAQKTLAMKRKSSKKQSNLFNIQRTQSKSRQSNALAKHFQF